MQAHGAAARRQPNDGLAVELALRALSDLVDLVGKPGEEVSPSAGVRIAIERIPQALRRADNFAAVGDEHVCEHGRLADKPGLPNARGMARPLDPVERASGANCHTSKHKHTRERSPAFQPPNCVRYGTASISSWDPWPTGPRIERHLLVKRARAQGLLILDFADRWEASVATLAEWVRAGRLRYEEEILEGLELAPDALAGLYRGENKGKRLIRVWT
jgi:hypothetical protein